MHKQNSDYGHRAILASAAAIADERPIWGILQHGWTELDGWSSMATLPKRFPRLVWSDRALARVPPWRATAAYHAVGSPFAYLVQDLPTRLSIRPSLGDEVLAFPAHSAETARVRSEHAAYARELREREGRGVRVCLYWLDMKKPNARAAYEREGHEVWSLGSSRRDRYFIPRFLRALQGAGRVISNKLSTSVLYAAALGLEAEVYGLEFRAEDDSILKPDIVQAFSGKIDVDFSRAELGFHNLLSPRELRESLGWSGWRLPVGGLVDSVLTTRSSVKYRSLQGLYDRLLTENGYECSRD